MSRLVGLTSVLLVLLVVVGAAAAAPPPDIDATGAVLYAPVTGDFLFVRNPDEPLAPASLSKIMTLYIAYRAIEAGEITPDATVVVSEKAWRTTGSRMFIEVGEEVTIADLIAGIAVVSGNDACVALAERIAGTEQGFVDRMNEAGRGLGMTGSHFANSHGLDAEGQIVTPRDVALMSAALVTRFQESVEELSKKEFTYGGITQPNRNRLLWTDERVDGLKTGYTREAGYSIAVSARTHDLKLIAVIMGTESEDAREQQAARLLEWGFSNFTTVEPLREGDEVGGVRVWQGATDSVIARSPMTMPLTISRQDRNLISLEFEPLEGLRAPIAAGDRIGTINVLVRDREVATAAAVAAQDVPRGSWWRRLVDAIRLWLARM